MNVTVVDGDLLDQDVDVIVNAWNRNIIPWWLLLPQGVSGAIKKRAGKDPFREVGRHGAIPLGGAVLTWRASERSIRHSVRNAIQLAQQKGFQSIAFPLIGAGSGGFNQEQAKSLMLDELSKFDVPISVRLVVFQKAKRLFVAGVARTH